MLQTCYEGIRHIWTANKSNCMEKVEIYASDDITLGYLSMNSSDEHWSDDQSSIVENDLLFQPFRVQ